MNPTCQRCQKTVSAVYRANEKGVAGIWYCHACMVESGVAIDEEVADIVTIIEKARLKR